MNTLLLALALQAPAPEVDAASRANEFAFAFYPRLLEASKGRNLFVSPLSIELALCLALAGARGPCREEMAAALGWGSLADEEIDTRCAALLAALRRPDPAVKLQIANSAWSRDGYPLVPAYAERLRTRYGAQAESLPFDAAGAARINGWVKESTAGKIEGIVPAELPGDAMLYLINAVYFKGDWAVPFDKKLTRDQDFHLADGGAKPKPFMSRKGRIDYLETPLFQAVRLPYGAAGKTACYVFVPSGTSTLDVLQRQLTAATWAGWMSKFRSRDVLLELPRFRLAWEGSLVKPLQALGLRKAFGAGADFSGIGGGGLFISEVRHKTFVDLNEEGTEAAAVTSVQMSVTSAPPPPKLVRADRPFLLALRDEATGALLFLGSLVDP